MADSYAPVAELDGEPNLLTTSYVVGGFLDGWYRQPFLPVSNTAFGRWLMDRAGYTPPAPDTPVPGPTTGQGWPR